MQENTQLSTIKTLFATKFLCVNTVFESLVFMCTNLLDCGFCFFVVVEGEKPLDHLGVKNKKKIK